MTPGNRTTGRSDTDIVTPEPTQAGPMSCWFGTLSGFRSDAVAFGLGAAAALALPPLYILPVLLVAIPGLIRLIDAARTPLIALRRGWWFGVGFHVIGLYWITEAILIEAARYWWLIPLAVPSLAAVLAIFVGLAAMVARLPPLIKGYLRLGGFVGDGAVIDPQFNTTDVAVVVKTDLVTDKYYRHYERQQSETPDP